MTISRMKSRQKGVALVVGLILVAVASLGAIVAIRGSHLQDRMASNQHNKAISEMAAEAGAGRFIKWAKTRFDKGINAAGLEAAWKDRDNEEDNEEKKNLPSEITEEPQLPPFGFIVASPQWPASEDATLTVSVLGMARAGGETLAETEIRFQLNLPDAGPGSNSPLPPPAPLTLGGNVVDFGAGSSNNFEIIGGANNAAIATDSNDIGSDAIVIASIVGDKKKPSKSADNYTGNGIGPPSVKSTDLGPTWGSAEGLQKLVETAEETGDKSIRVVRGDAELKGNSSEGGILIVTGNLRWSGTPSFAGLIVVLGGTVDWGGGGNGGITGAIYVADVDQSGEKWTFASGDRGVKISGGGGAQIKYDEKIVTNALAVLKGKGNRVFSVQSWNEVLK